MKGCRSMKDFHYEDHIGLWKNELADFMPDRYFDVHEHIGPEDLVAHMDEARFRSALTTYTGVEWEELLSLYSQMYPGKEMRYAACFGFVLHEIDVRQANTYVLEKARADSRLLPLLLFSPRDPQALPDGYAQAQAMGVKVYGVKPYFDFADRPGHFTAMDVEMEDFVSEDMLRFCNEHSMVFMFHTCGIGMGDPVMRRNVQRILDEYPNLKLILAHMGRFYYKEQFFDFMASDFLEKNKDKPFWFDVSSVTEPDVFRLAFSREEMLPRMLFAADHPYGIFPGIEMYSETMGGIFLTRETFPWSDPKMLEQFSEECKNLTYNNYHCLKAIKDAIAVNIPADRVEKVKEDLFYRNACKVFGVPE